MSHLSLQPIRCVAQLIDVPNATIDDLLEYSPFLNSTHQEAVPTYQINDP